MANGIVRKWRTGGSGEGPGDLGDSPFLIYHRYVEFLTTNQQTALYDFLATHEHDRLTDMLIPQPDGSVFEISVTCHSCGITLGFNAPEARDFRIPKGGD